MKNPKVVAETDAAAQGDTSLVSGATSEHNPPHPEPDSQPPSDGGLLPCPFCGGLPVCLDEAGDDDFVVMCKGCGSHSQYSDYRNKAIAAWNTRANPPTEPVAKITARRNGMKEWLTKNAPYIFADQKHLDENTTERAYWHYGYFNALNDVLHLLATPTPEGDFVLVPTVVDIIEILESEIGLKIKPIGNIRNDWTFETEILGIASAARRVQAMIAAAPNPPSKEPS